MKNCLAVVSLCKSGCHVGAVVLLAGCAIGLWSPVSAAGAPAEVDLSVSVSMTPATFVPGGHSTFTVTVHNAGPDAAGASNSDFGSIIVIGGDFIVTKQPPPYEVIAPVTGECFIERAVTEPLLDGNIALVFIYYFRGIPAGESRSCSSEIEFYPSTRSSFSTTWEVYTPRYDDTKPGNDEIEYVFRLRPTAIPAASPITLILLGLGLFAAVVFACRHWKQHGHGKLWLETGRRPR